MCGRFYVPEDASIQMIRAIVERLEHRNVKVKTGDVFPGDMAAVVASNRQLQPQPFAMEWGYHLTDGKQIINARVRLILDYIDVLFVETCERFF